MVDEGKSIWRNKEEGDRQLTTSNDMNCHDNRVDIASSILKLTFRVQRAN